LSESSLPPKSPVLLEQLEKKAVVLINLLYSQGKKKRQHGVDAVKSHILAAKTVANIVKSSLVCKHYASSLNVKP
jgi:hypothetical protein